jgi:tRNA(Arg) A34 adenosine deaminase TadA
MTHSHSEITHITPQDLTLLRQSITLAHEARAHSAHPFGALIADAAGQVLVTARNNAIPPKGDPTQHAERLACALAGRRYQPEFLATCTLYTSTEPCPMCAAAIYWTGIRRLIYALSAQSLYKLTATGSPSLHLPCRELLAHGSHLTEIHGPHLEAEALQPHLNFWTPTTS